MADRLVGAATCAWAAATQNAANIAALEQTITHRFDIRKVSVRQMERLRLPRHNSPGTRSYRDREAPSTLDRLPFSGVLAGTRQLRMARSWTEEGAAEILPGQEFVRSCTTYGAGYAVNDTIRSLLERVNPELGSFLTFAQISYFFLLATTRTWRVVNRTWGERVVDNVCLLLLMPLVRARGRARALRPADIA